ncbi:MAG: hypothetical protein C5S48_05555 [Candidatus Methanogaster sp.]|nr:MAG: hypothetical protein C5S48_05555 [ANME-2 cluster archaeon]
MRTGCETTRFLHMRGLLLATTENSRTRKIENERGVLLRLVLDSDVLVHASRIPMKKDLMEIHENASVIFESCILKTNHLFLPSEIPVEVSAVLSKIIPQELAREGIEKLLLTTEEIYPFASDMVLNSIYPISSNIYFQEALET